MIYLICFREHMASYMKELGQLISNLDFSWIKGSFVHSITAALEDLSLKDKY